jgi:NAD(P)-dependent dehydrogenase (short-subunit alcohol dehydrogenase family)
MFVFLKEDPYMEGRLVGKVALVTGGGSGIGRASSLAFAKEGARVVVADIENEKGRETVSLIEKKGGQAIFVNADISKSDQVESLVNKAVRTYGRLDCAHNNAGILGAMRLTADYEEDEWERIVRINVTGTWLCIKYEIPQMLAQKSGSIVNTASVLGLVGSGRAPAYSTSKHAVVGLTKSAALSYAESGIRINAICPGFTETPMIDPLTGGDPKIEADMHARHPIGRMAKPEEVAEAAIWLCSDAASFVTGHAMAVDGGFVA